MDVAEVTTHLATCIILKGYQDNMLHNEDLKELCGHGFDKVKEWVESKLYVPFYPDCVYKDNDIWKFKI